VIVTIVHGISDCAESWAGQLRLDGGSGPSIPISSGWRRDVEETAGNAALVDAFIGSASDVAVRDVGDRQEMAVAVRAGADLLQWHYLVEAVPAIDRYRVAHGTGTHPGCAW